MAEHHHDYKHELEHAYPDEAATPKEPASESGKTHLENDPLFTPDLVTAIENYIDAKAAAQRMFARARYMYDDPGDVIKRFDQMRRNSHNELARTLMSEGLIPRKYDGLNAEETMAKSRETALMFVDMYEREKKRIEESVKHRRTS